VWRPPHCDPPEDADDVVEVGGTLVKPTEAQHEQAKERTEYPDHQEILLSHWPRRSG